MEGRNNLSGDLTHAYSLPDNAFFIGLLSRFYLEPPPPSFQLPLKKKYDVMVIISGPEPQRSIFEELILKQAQTIPLNFLIVKGITEQIPKLETTDNLDIVSHLPTAEMRSAILSASIIVSRSGYSTLMDLAALNKRAAFVPTPGQTEQEYLAERCMKKGISYYEDQSNFNLKNVLEKGKMYSGFGCLEGGGLEERIEKLLS